ncbi:MAG: hypothetical protein WCV88_03840 [Patescibacteria group bacterium]|jgi:hypothetical protein
MKSKLPPILITSIGFLVPLITLATDTGFSPVGDAASVTITTVIAIIIQVLLGIVGSGALLMFIWGGLHMVFSGGNEENLKKGKSTLIWATIGLVIVLSAYALTSFVFGILKTASGA